MRYELTGTEKCIVWKSLLWARSSMSWAVAIGSNGSALNYPVYFATWREAMDYATGDR